MPGSERQRHRRLARRSRRTEAGGLLPWMAMWVRGPRRRRSDTGLLPEEPRFLPSQGLLECVASSAPKDASMGALLHILAGVPPRQPRTDLAPAEESALPVSRIEPKEALQCCLGILAASKSPIREA